MGRLGRSAGGFSRAAMFVAAITVSAGLSGCVDGAAGDGDGAIFAGGLVDLGSSGVALILLA